MASAYYLPSGLPDEDIGEVWADPPEYFAPTPPQLHYPSEPGYCYLVLFRKDVQGRALAALGKNPTGLSLQSWLDSNRSDWSAGKFRLVIGAEPVTMEYKKYTQAHVFADSLGLTHGELLQQQLSAVRVGAMPGSQEPTDSQLASAGPSVRAVVAPAPNPVVKIPFYTTLTTTTPYASLSPRTSTTVTGLTKYFESATLVGFGMSVSVAGGDASSCFFGVNTSSTSIAASSGFLSMPMCTIYSGSSQGIALGEFTLPPDHGFGTEVKAVSVGNPDPVFHWRLEVPDGGTGTVIVRGYVALRLAGAGVPTPFGLPATAPRRQ